MDKKLQGYSTRSVVNKRRMESNPKDNHGQQPPFKRQNVSGQNMARAYTAENNQKRGSATTVPNTQRAPLGNYQGVICYECGRPRHEKRECPKLRNQNHGNRVGNKTGNQTGGNKATARAYTIGGGGTNPDSNVVTVLCLMFPPSTLDTSYAVELADGRISKTNVVLRGCTLGLLGHPFVLNLMPVELGSFDVIIVNSLDVPDCDDALEMAQHLFIDYTIARNLWV
ncbi:putative reverse transcriptase domain-containing protein [Tanacetum coccineum]